MARNCHKEITTIFSLKRKRSDEESEKGAKDSLEIARPCFVKGGSDSYGGGDQTMSNL